MCKQHTSEKGLCREFEFDLLLLSGPSYLHFALLTLCCSLPGSGDDHKKPFILFLLCVAVLCYFSRKYGNSSREIHSVGKTPPHPSPCIIVLKSYLDSFNAMRYKVCSKNVCVSVLFHVLWLTMTILFVDPDLIDTNCNCYDAVP